MNINEWLNTDNKLSEDIWNRKYRYNNETFDQWLDRVSQNNKDFKDIIQKRQFLAGGRTLSNIGVPDNSSLFNCYSSGYVPDDYAGIMDIAKNIGLTYKSQGGQGLSLSKLRPIDTPIGDRYVSDGIVPFMKIFNEVTEATSQAGSRKGALMMSLDVWHKEALNFITIKSKDGLIEKANLSLEIDDEFMKCIEEFYENGIIKTIKRKENYSGHEIEWEVTPIEVYNRLVENSWDYGDPACLFVNKFRNYNIMEKDNEYNIVTSNPCVTGDTKILTNNGYEEIETLIGKKVNVWNGYEWSEVEPKITGENQDICLIEFSDGCELKCTPYHKFILKDGRRIEAKDLKIGDKLMKYNMPIIQGIKELKHGYTQGFFSGDGFIRKETNSPYITLYDGKRHIKLDIKNIRSHEEKRDTYSVYVDFNDKEFVPDSTYTIKSRLEWLSGIVDSDGCSCKDGSIQITSVNKEFLKKIKFMLNTLGINPILSISRKAQKRLLPDGNGCKKEYNCKETYRINISAYFVSRLNELGFETQRVEHSYIPSRISSRFITIKNINLNCEKAEKVYCFTENKNHSGIFGGIMTAQCGEQPLPPNGACCLGSINLSEFVMNPYTDNAYFDFEEFKKVVRLGINYMDNLIEVNYNRHPLKEQREVSYNYRNIGLGVMGYANMLMKLNMVYGEDDSLKFTDDLFNCMFRTSVEASSELAKEKGSFPKYSEVVWESEIMRNHFTEEEINQLRQNGLRNCSLLSVAPTGTLSSLLGVSGGCEPEFALSFTRRTVGLTDNKDAFYKVYCKSVKEYMDLNNLKDDSKLPKWFISSENIPYINRIKTQGIMQKHIDTAISSTINLPENTTKEQVADIYLQAWKHGLKGITIFRTNCKRIAILSTTDSNKEEKETKDSKLKRGQLVRNDNIIGLKRTLITGCGTLHCSAFFDKNNGEFVELFLGKGSQGGCLSTLNGLARLTSLSARAGVKLVDIVGQLKSANACPSYAIRSATKKDTSKGSCCPSAIANALIDMQKEMKNLIKVTNISEINKESIQENDENKCPVCGSEIHHSGGCVECKNCGWAKCG